MIVKVSSYNLKKFILYCKKYAKEHDDSFIPGDNFVPDYDHPSFLLMGKEDEIVGAASLILEEPFRKAKKGRFMVFHCLDETVDNYRKLLNSVLPNCSELDKLYLFVPEKKHTEKLFKEIGFTFERQSYLMKRELGEIPIIKLSDTYSFRNFDCEKDAEIYCEIINKSFSNMAGHITIDPPNLRKLLNETKSPDNGIQFLCYKDVPIGLVFTEFDNTLKDCISIGPVAVLPEYQGKGLGRILLRKGIEIASSNGYDSWLSVNEENTRAVKLYLSEGFKIIDHRKCYHFLL
ncbi:MAG: GNAT family N-acetyltransferase [Kosmotoga sp.]|nr:MAG: GNAT family N-acetyltransferase [Kosmotoga sp.]